MALDPLNALGSFAVVYVCFTIGVTVYSLYLGYKQSLVKKNTERIIELLEEQNKILKSHGTK